MMSRWSRLFFCAGFFRAAETRSRRDGSSSTRSAIRIVRPPAVFTRYVAEHRELIHKIGVTGGKVEARIAKASQEATYLLADVTVVATYTLANINRTKLDSLFHRIFAPAHIALEITDRFGTPVRPQQWFLVPMPVIDEAVRAIRDGSITRKVYDPTTARLVEM